MTYNVFGGILNLTQPTLINSYNTSSTIISPSVGLLTHTLLVAYSNCLLKNCQQPTQHHQLHREAMVWHDPTIRDITSIDQTCLLHYTRVHKSSRKINNKNNSNLTNSTTCGVSGDVRRSNLCSICITVVKTDVSVVVLSSEMRTVTQAACSVLNRAASLPIAPTAASATYNTITCSGLQQVQLSF